MSILDLYKAGKDAYKTAYEANQPEQPLEVDNLARQFIPDEKPESLLPISWTSKVWNCDKKWHPTTLRGQIGKIALAAVLAVGTVFCFILEISIGLIVKPFRNHYIVPYINNHGVKKSRFYLAIWINQQLGIEVQLPEFNDHAATISELEEELIKLELHHDDLTSRINEQFARTEAAFLQLEAIRAATNPEQLQLQHNTSTLCHIEKRIG